MSSVADVEPKASVIAGAHPFSELGLEPCATLASESTRLFFASSEAIYLEGDAADAAYLVVAGSVQLSGTDAIVGPGHIFGGEDLVTGAPRSRTASAREATELYALPQRSLVALAKRHTGFAAHMRDRAWLQAQPRRAESVYEHPQTDDGLLLESSSGVFFRVDERDASIWHQIDGRNTLSDLVRLALREELRRLATRKAAPLGQLATSAAPPVDDAGFSRPLTLTLQLADAGFVRGMEIARDWSDDVPRSRTALQRFSALGRMLWHLHDVGAHYERAYRSFGFVLFERASLGLLLPLIVAGLLAFIAASRTGEPATQPLGIAAAVYAITFVSSGLHELAHGLATVWSGCKVRSMGVGWYWFGPIAFVDTTDTWRAARWQRLVVGAAGPYVTLLIASVLSLVALIVDGTSSRIAYWAASANYAAFAFNFNPFLRLDGYLMLTDWLDRPNLRRDSLRWLGRAWTTALREPRALWRHRLELIYGAGLLAYLTFIVTFVMRVGRFQLAAFLGTWLSPRAAAYWATGLATVVVLLAAADLAWELVPQADARNRGTS